jgi:hypothetical protein
MKTVNRIIYFPVNLQCIILPTVRQCDILSCSCLPPSFGSLLPRGLGRGAGRARGASGDGGGDVLVAADHSASGAPGRPGGGLRHHALRVGTCDADGDRAIRASSSVYIGRVPIY